VKPRQIIDHLEKCRPLPAGPEERFHGYGVMGLPFTTGDILAMRRFPASSLGEGYTSVWHRDPEGSWTFYQNVSPEKSCARYFGSMVSRAEIAEIDIHWTADLDFSMTVKGSHRLQWQVSLGHTLGTRVLSGVGNIVPGGLWKSPTVLRSMGKLASMALGAGRINLVGRSPNGQTFMANPRRIWTVAVSRAGLDGQDLGPIGRHPFQARLADFWIPNGLFAIGSVYLEALDPARHKLSTSQERTLVVRYGEMPLDWPGIARGN
jgi:hypothetical protein